MLSEKLSFQGNFEHEDLRDENQRKNKGGIKFLSDMIISIT